MKALLTSNNLYTFYLNNLIRVCRNNIKVKANWYSNERIYNLLRNMTFYINNYNN